jgi:LysM repeat protein
MIRKKVLIIGLIAGMLGWQFTGAIQAASPPKQEKGQAYVVQADDSLSQLAEKYLGEANLWPEIVEATNLRAKTDARLAVITNPNVIHPGQVVIIPTAGQTLPESVEPSPTEVGLGGLCQEPDPVLQAFCAEIPIARINFDPHEEAEFFTCAGRAGLASAQLDPDGVTILAPNDGDFDLRGITASIKVTPDKAVLIPRWPGSKFDFSAEFAEKFKLPVGEQLEIPLAKAFELVKAGELTWTGQHGVAGKAGLFQTNPPLTCDPQADIEIELGPFKPEE